jgi:hypothetical protein
MKLKYGTTRTVILTKNYAIKIPTFVTYKLFLNGLLGNMQEHLFWKHLKSYKLCPILFYIIGGFLLVMPRAKELTREEFFNLDFEEFMDEDKWLVPVENKLDSFGWYKGKIVAVDYGS